MDKLTSMRAFTKVVALGSFSEAAREMRLSRSAVSKYVIDLEADLGVQLLNRTTRSASPTDNGRLYYERCLAILAEIEDADRTASHLQAEPRGLLRVNAPMSFGTLHMGRAVAELMTRYRDMQIELILTDQQLDTVQAGFDVTIRIADLTASALIARKIVPARRVLCASPAYLERAGTPTHPRELRDHDCLSYGNLATGMQWKLSGKDGDHWLAVPWRLNANNAEVLRDAAVRGHGIALLPTFIAYREIGSGALRTFMHDYRAPELAVYAVYPPTRYLPLKLRVFIDFLVEQFGDRPYWDEGIA